VPKLGYRPGTITGAVTRRQCDPGRSRDISVVPGTTRVLPAGGKDDGTAMTEGAQQAGSDSTAIREFQVTFPEAELTELRRRINATRWPERETGSRPRRPPPAGIPSASYGPG